jgi:hypothetical protein
MASRGLVLWRVQGRALRVAGGFPRVPTKGMFTLESRMSRNRSGFLCHE